MPKLSSLTCFKFMGLLEIMYLWWLLTKDVRAEQLFVLEW